MIRTFVGAFLGTFCAWGATAVWLRTLDLRAGSPLCAFCGWVPERGPLERRRIQIRAHIVDCNQHPMARVRQDLSEARSVLREIHTWSRPQTDGPMLDPLAITSFPMDERLARIHRMAGSRS